MKRLLLLPVLLLLSWGCTANYDDILTLFFDGVHPPQKPVAEISQRKLTAAKVIQLVQHDPYEGGECAECHDLNKSSLNGLVKPMPKLCFQCHDAEDFQGETVHSPVEDGECTECHSPHESPNKLMLKKPLDQLCFTCHDQEDFEAENMHSPVEDGDCAECHNPHASPHKVMLRGKVAEVCFGCHDQDDLHTEADDEKLVKIVQGKSPQACTKCHNPHGGDAEFFLKK